MRVSRAVIGVDPGGTGAIAAVDLETLELIGVVDMPMAADEVAVPLLGELPGRLAGLGYVLAAVAIERVGPMPRQGVASSFKFGRRFGGVEGFFGARWPTVLITPTAWKSAARITGKDKDAARLLAIQTWPGSAELFARKKDVGRADAALIARHHAATGLFGNHLPVRKAAAS
jgi:hypothetical protein